MRLNDRSPFSKGRERERRVFGKEEEEFALPFWLLSESNNEQNTKNRHFCLAN
jgi:hypothetical protein